MGCDGRTCVVAFLPHILDDFAAGRKENLKILDSALQATKKDGKSIGFLWSQGGDQFELEEKLGLQFGFPAVIAVNFGANSSWIGSSQGESVGRQRCASPRRGLVRAVPHIVHVIVLSCCLLS